MAAELTERVREIAEAQGVAESAILEEALERGVEDLWTELVLSQYLTDEIDRERAVDLVGHDAVTRADREVEAVEEDVRWGRNA